MEGPKEIGGAERGLESSGRRFSYLLDKYHQLHERIKTMQKGHDGPVDETTQERLFRLDEMRNSIHKELKELGARLGKSERDVLVDIIREQKTLATYGLPEFTLLTENDITLSNDWHNPYYFNVDTSERMPGSSIPSDPKAGAGVEETSSEESEDDGYEAVPIMKPDECMIVFAIVPIVNYGEDALEPLDYDIRTTRAEALASKVQGALFHTSDSSYHEAYAKILGVVIKKKDLEDIARLIRENPNEYRLEEKYYSPEDFQRIEKRKEWEAELDEDYGYEDDERDTDDEESQDAP